LVSILATVQVVGDKAIDRVLEKVDVAVFFTQNTSSEQLQSIQDQLQSRDDVLRVDLITADEAYEQFRLENEDDPVIRESLEALGLNPLGPVLVLKAKTLDDYPAILSLFDSESIKPLIQDKARDFESKRLVIERLSTIITQLRKVGLVLVGIFVLIACLVMYNTIRITIYTHREEIGIMKLVGASNAYVRLPFIIESTVYALVASVLTAGLFYPAIAVAAPTINRFFEGYDFSLLATFHEFFWPLALIQLAGAILLGVVTATIAVNRYVRV
jgi:cell division transport system permease protein